METFVRGKVDQFQVYRTDFQNSKFTDNIVFEYDACFFLICIFHIERKCKIQECGSC